MLPLVFGVHVTPEDRIVVVGKNWRPHDKVPRALWVLSPAKGRWVEARAWRGRCPKKQLVWDWQKEES